MKENRIKQIEPNICASFYKAVTHFCAQIAVLGGSFLIGRTYGLTDGLTQIRTYRRTDHLIEDNLLCKYSVAHSAFKEIVKYNVAPCRVELPLYLVLIIIEDFGPYDLFNNLNTKKWERRSAGAPERRSAGAPYCRSSGEMHAIVADDLFSLFRFLRALPLPVLTIRDKL